MNPNSEELARRINVMVAFQNGELVQYRNRGSSNWITMFKEGNLSFDWERCDFRVKSQPREGFVFAGQLHQHPSDHTWKKGEGTCFPVCEVIKE